MEVRRSSATFYLRTAYQKRSKRTALDKFPTMSVADARKVCAERKRQFVLQVLSGVLNTNVDMRFDVYYEQHFLPWCKIYKRTYSSHQSMYKIICKRGLVELYLAIYPLHIYSSSLTIFQNLAIIMASSINAFNICAVPSTEWRNCAVLIHTQVFENHSHS